MLMNIRKPVYRCLTWLFCLALLCMLVSCAPTEDRPPSGTDPLTQTERDTSTETESASATETDIESATDTAPTSETSSETAAETSSETASEVASDTIPATETPPETETETLPETSTETDSESETESETESIPAPTVSPDCIRFDGEDILPFLTTTGCRTELFHDAEVGTVLKVQASAPVNYVVFDYEGYMSAAGLTPISVENYRFAAVTFRTGAGYGNSHNSSTFHLGCASGATEACKPTDSLSSLYDAGDTEWQTVLVDLRAGGWSGRLHKLLLTGAYKTRAKDSYCLSSLTFTNTVTADALSKPLVTEVPVKGLAAPYTVLQITDLHACSFTEEEAAAMSPERYADLQGRVSLFWGQRPLRPEDILPAVGQYAADIDADLILATGDMIDFPSEANLSLLSGFVTSSPVPVLYMAGNHDWTYSDDYMTAHAIETYLPRITALAGAVDGVAVYDTGTIVFITVDNSPDRISDATLQAYLSAVADARAKGRSVVLALHVPFTVDTLVADCTRVWNRNICIGEGGLSSHHEPTMALFRAVTEGTEFAPDAVVSGHLHFSHEDVFPNGVPQLITADASGDGLCRVIRFLPATA